MRTGGRRPSTLISADVVSGWVRRCARRVGGVAVVLVTGMPGVGKSSALELLAGAGHQTVETDDPWWLEAEIDVPDNEWQWHESRIRALLGQGHERHLFVAGTRENHGSFYEQFDAICVLTAPAAMLMKRLRTRTNNPYGQTPAQRRQVLRHVDEVEPLLLRSATHVVYAGAPLVEVVARLEAIADLVDQ